MLAVMGGVPVMLPLQYWLIFRPIGLYRVGGCARFVFVGFGMFVHGGVDGGVELVDRIGVGEVDDVEAFASGEYVVVVDEVRWRIDFFLAFFMWHCGVGDIISERLHRIRGYGEPKRGVRHSQ